MYFTLCPSTTATPQPRRQASPANRARQISRRSSSEIDKNISLQVLKGRRRKSARIANSLSLFISSGYISFILAYLSTYLIPHSLSSCPSARPLPLLANLCYATHSYHLSHAPSTLCPSCLLPPFFSLLFNMNRIESINYITPRPPEMQLKLR